MQGRRTLEEEWLQPSYSQRPAREIHIRSRPPRCSGRVDRFGNRVDPAQEERLGIRCTQLNGNAQHLDKQVREAGGAPSLCVN